MKITLFGWLLKNELRLWWRRTTDIKHFWAWAIFIALVVASVLFFIWLGFSALRVVTNQAELPDATVWVAGGLWLLGLIFAFNQAVNESVVVLFERGDLDLLMSSPVPSRAILAVRLLSVALSVFLGFCLFVVPASLLAVFTGFPELLGVYPTLISICLIAASLGMLVTLQIVRWVGARRARSLVQFLNLILTLVMVLGFQIPNYLISTGADLSGVWEQFQALTAPGSLFSVRSWIWFPAKAMLLEPVSVCLMLGVSGAIATATVYALDNAFIRGTQQSTSQKRRARPEKDLTLQEGFSRVVLTKEWRTMRRHPYLVSQIALQVVLILPLTWILIQGGEDSPLLDIGRVSNVAMPFLGGQLSYALTFVCLSGEEAADLLKSSPASGFKLRRLKQLAALVPVWLLLLPAIALLIAQGYPWIPALVATLGASIGASFLRLWNSRPVPISDLFRRRKLDKTDLLLTFVESFSPWAWVGLGSSLYAGSGPFVFLSVCGLATLFSIGYWRGRQLGSHLHY